MLNEVKRIVSNVRYIKVAFKYLFKFFLCFILLIRERHSLLLDFPEYVLWDLSTSSF